MKTDIKLGAIMKWYGDISKQDVIRMIMDKDLSSQYRSMCCQEYANNIAKLWKIDMPISKQTGECIHYTYKYLRLLREVE